MDPREIELSMLDVLRELGFNRISLGVQDFNKAVQVAVNREQDNDFIPPCWSGPASWDSVPPTWISSTACRTQNRESFHHTLEEVLKTDPARLSIFNYAHLPSRFAAQHKLKEADMPAPWEKLAMLQDTIAFPHRPGLSVHRHGTTSPSRTTSWRWPSARASCTATSRAIPPRRLRSLGLGSLPSA